MQLPSLTKAEFYALLTPFLTLLEKEQNDRIATVHPTLQEGALKKGRRGYHEIGYDEGLRFVRVWSWNDSQHMVKYFVEKNTGIIFGASSWKKYNPNHIFGDLTTINDWMWDAHYGVSKKGIPSLVPKVMRR